MHIVGLRIMNWFRDPGFHLQKPHAFNCLGNELASMSWCQQQMDFCAKTTVEQLHARNTFPVSVETIVA